MIKKKFRFFVTFTYISSFSVCGMKYFSYVHFIMKEIQLNINTFFLIQKEIKLIIFFFLLKHNCYKTNFPKKQNKM